ncbi:TetR/AcrR family transcriptional regulator [Photobacterium sp. SDRW27]|uniref:TetR/AcrR family transcriptional regulator n=1 Tax=Photobacterium obscurum TaxID=2829490 RepID=UPI002243D2DD|nr:TetR/AcrR family transcriptional regulator [Photobacterium obscurum]MCW8327202.1 TetR/AcrR family transcriptional regulator [Photobacterium obscurum]
MSRIREKNQELIIQVACQLFAEQGYAATKVADIAKVADVPKPNIYYYFKAKDNLYRAVLESVTLPLLEASKPIEQLDDPSEALSEYIKAKLRISRDHPYASKVFANEVMSGAKYLPEDIAEKLHAQSTMIIAKFTGWIERGAMADISPQHLMFTIWAATQTYADFSWQICKVMEKDQLDEQDFADAATFLTQLVIRGCQLEQA